LSRFITRREKTNEVCKWIQTAIEICENGIDQQYLVFVNGNKYKAMNTFGKKINLNNA
jgi:uncharacterized linocin/CFP29 family protein